MSRVRSQVHHLTQLHHLQKQKNMSICLPSNGMHLRAGASSRFISLHCISFIHSLWPLSQEGQRATCSHATLLLDCFVLGCSKNIEKEHSKNCLGKTSNDVVLFQESSISLSQGSRLPLKTFAFRKWEKLLMQSHFRQPRYALRT